MKKKRILFLFVTLFASTLLYSQVVGIKTNVVMDALKVINLGAEVGLSKKLTLDLYANYNPWKYKDQKMMKMLNIFHGLEAKTKRNVRKLFHILLAPSERLGYTESSKKTAEPDSAVKMENKGVYKMELVTVREIYRDTEKYLYDNSKTPAVSSIGGEWLIMGLSRNDGDIPVGYYENYYNNVVNYVKECGGVLHNKKYTEYSRVIIALTSIGKDPKNVGGYNLLLPLGDFEKTTWQGINGAIWALIALDCGQYDMPYNADAQIHATREMYVEKIINSQLDDGGWSLLGSGESDVDVTAMALQALSNYTDNSEVSNCVNKAIPFLSASQNENGGYSSWGTENSESCAQVIVALCELGISPFDERFEKNGKNLADNLMSYYTIGDGFKHTYDGDGSNQMATEQCFYSLVSLKRFMNGDNSLYDMSDVRNISQNEINVIKNSLQFVMMNLILLRK